MKEVDLKGKTILVTGAAGFIGAALCEELKRAGALDEDFDLDAHIRLEPLQPGDVPVIFADVSGLEKDFGFHPSTSLKDGLRSFCEWYAGYSDRA